MNISKQIKVALLVILSIALFIFGLNYMKGTTLGGLDPIYHAEFDNVEGLYKSNKVYINGVQVGFVKDIEFADPSNLTKIKVLLEIDRKFEIPKNSTAILYSVDFLGQKAIKIDISKEKEMLQNGDKLNAVFDQGMLGSIGNQLSPIATDAGKLLGNMNTLFDKKNSQNVYGTISNADAALISVNEAVVSMNKLIAANQTSINGTLKNIESLTANLEKKNGEIAAMISNFNAVSGQVKDAHLDQTVANLNKAVGELNKTLSEINNGNGTLTKLIKDPSVYDKLDQTVKSANDLLVDMKANPKRYVSFSLISKPEKKK